MPNLYPAFDHQEVVIHSPAHVRSFSDLPSEQLGLVAEMWHRRAEAAWADGGFSYVHAMINEGREAGASLPHSHSQLVWLREPPPEVIREQPHLRQDDCELCRLLEQESLIVEERGGVVMLAAFAGRVPYELLIAPREHWHDAPGQDGGDFLVTALELFANGIRRLRAIEGAVPFNAWLHNSGHWHIEVIPRLSVFAGLELGAGLYVNWLPPEEAAAALRNAMS